jgi:type IV pilus assembly protein PilC
VSKRYSVSSMNKLRTYAKNFRFGRAPKAVAAHKPGAAEKKHTAALPSTLFLRFSVKEQMLFAKRLSFMVKGGVPLVESLHLIRRQTKSKGRGLIYDSIIRDVSSGQYLSTSLNKFKNLFGDFTINLIRVGENSGVLSQNLAYLADELQKHSELKRKIRGALVYPVFITVVTLLVTSLLTVFIFPKIMPIFISLNVPLPLSTRVLLATSVYLQQWGILTLFLVVGMVAAFLFIRTRLESLHYWTDVLLLKLPIAGKMARAYNLANACRTLGLLLKSGISLNESLGITAETTKNRVYRHAMHELGEEVIKGNKLSSGLEKYPKLFPDMMPHMILIGESTGNLASSLLYLSELYEGEVESLTKGLSSSIEPVLMVIMGLLVGLIAVSVITPIYEVTQHLQPR